MTISALLQQLETLTSAQRFRFMIHLGRASLTDIDLSSTLQELANGDFYERFLLIQSCYGSRNATYVLQFLRDPSLSLRRQAVNLVPLASSPEQVALALELADRQLSVHLLKLLRKYAFQEQVDAFLLSLAESEESRLIRLVSYGSPELVERLLPQLLPRFTVEDWVRLVRRQPDITLALLWKSVEEKRDPQYVLRNRLKSVLPLLVHSRPDASLQLVKELRHTFPLDCLCLSNLLRERPNEVIDLVLEENTLIFSEKELTWAVCSITFERVLRLAQQGWLIQIENGAWSRHWLMSLTPKQRGILYEKHMRYWRDNQGQLDNNIVAQLPRQQREQEGIRHIALLEPLGGFSYMYYHIPFLPWDQAYATLQPYFRHVDIATRSLALEALAITICYHRQYLEDLLTLFLAHKNDPDTVRRSMFGHPYGGLTRIPPGAWQPRHLSLLDSFIQVSLEASDLSTQTAINITLLVTRLMPFHAAWSAAWLSKIMSERGNFPLHWIELYRLNKEERQQVIATFQPVFDTWERQEKLEHLQHAFRSIQTHLEFWDGLIVNIERLMQKVVSAWVCEDFLSILISKRPEQARRIIPLLLNADPSWIALSSVSMFVQRYRQDLLTPFLNQEYVRGRFNTGENRFVLSHPQSFIRWTKQQQEAFAFQQRAVVEDQTFEHHTRATALVYLSQLPALEPTLIFITARDAEHPLQVIAIERLSRLDRNQEQSVQVLLEILQRAEKRSREAMYTLRSLLTRIPERQAFVLLRTISLSRVTIAKEVIRLLGDLELEEAYQHLLAYQVEELHQDVYAALIRALWNHLDRAETWTLLERAAHQPKPAIVLALGHFPISQVAVPLQIRWLNLLKIVLESTDVETRISLLSCCHSYILDDEEQVLTPRLLELMQTTQGVEYQAVVTIFLKFSTYRDVLLAEKTFEVIRAERKKIYFLTEQLTQGLGKGWYRDRSFVQDTLPIIKVVLSVLKTDTQTAMLQAKLACRSLPPKQIVLFLLDLVQTDQMHPGVLTTIYTTFEQHGFLLLADGQAYLEQQLSLQEDARLRYIGLCVLKSQPSHYTDIFWTPERLARLQIYRNDPASMVAELAQFTFVPE